MDYYKKLFILTILSIFLLAGCASAPTQAYPNNTKEPDFTATKAAVTPSEMAGTPTLTPTLAGPTPSPTATWAPIYSPTPGTLPTVEVKDGWVTYRNDVVGYEISAPKDYTIQAWPAGDVIRQGLLGPKVPDQAVRDLVTKYYGDGLVVYMGKTDAYGHFQSGSIGIYAYDIIVNDLGGWVGQPGGGYDQTTSRQETLPIDFHSYPVKVTVELSDNQPVGEYAVLNLEKDGVELIFGSFLPKEDPEAYQIYLKEVWPEIRKIIETYRKLPEPTSLNGASAVNTANLQDAAPQAIARALFEQYLTGFQENPVDGLMKLSAYQIDDVQIQTKWQACAEMNHAEFIATVTYSVEPENWQLEKWAEDGYQTFDHWVRRKSAVMAIFREGQDYTMKILDEPICPGF